MILLSGDDIDILTAVITNSEDGLQINLNLINNPKNILKKTQELFFFDGNLRIAFPLRKGIAGHCASSGMGVIVNDPYSHEHFNRQVCVDFELYCSYKIDVVQQ